MTCSTTSNRLQLKPSLYLRYNLKLNLQWMLSLCSLVNQLKRMEAARHRMPAVILLKVQLSKHQVNSFSNNLMGKLNQRHKLEIIWEVQQCLLLISSISFPSNLKFSSRFLHQHSKRDQYPKLPWYLLRTRPSRLPVNLYNLNQRFRSLNLKPQYLTISNNLATMVKILVAKRSLQMRACSLVDNLQLK